MHLTNYSLQSFKIFSLLCLFFLAPLTVQNEIKDSPCFLLIIWFANPNTLNINRCCCCCSVWGNRSRGSGSAQRILNQQFGWVLSRIMAIPAASYYIGVCFMHCTKERDTTYVAKPKNTNISWQNISLFNHFVLAFRTRRRPEQRKPDTIGAMEQ